MKAVVFDIDDTLISEREFVLSGYHAVSKRLAGTEGLSAEKLYERLVTLSKDGYANIYDRLFESIGADPGPELIPELVRIYGRHFPAVHFYGDAVPAITRLKGMNIRLGIISDGDPVRQHNKLKACGGEEYFDRIIITDELGGKEYHKPDPRSFIKMAEALECTPEEMIYIGDNPEKDFYIMNELPVKTARIIRENGIYKDRGYLGGIKETWRLRELTDIVKIMEENPGVPA